MNSNKIIQDRIKTAKLILDVVLGKSTVLESIKKLPKDSKDDSINTCFHILVHFESDEDIRKKDSLYKETQDNFLIDIAETLSKGEPIPVNIIQEYKDFYTNDLIYHKMTKENILKRLLKLINI